MPCEIRRYPLLPSDGLPPDPGPRVLIPPSVRVEMPRDAHLLSIDYDSRRRLALWVLVNVGQPNIVRHLRIAECGETIAAPISETAGSYFARFEFAGTRFFVFDHGEGPIPSPLPDSDVAPRRISDRPQA